MTIQREVFSRHAFQSSKTVASPEITLADVDWLGRVPAFHSTNTFQLRSRPAGQSGSQSAQCCPRTCDDQKQHEDAKTPHLRVYLLTSIGCHLLLLDAFHGSLGSGLGRSSPRRIGLLARASLDLWISANLINLDFDFADWRHLGKPSESWVRPSIHVSVFVAVPPRHTRALGRSFVRVSIVLANIRVEHADPA